MKSNTLRNFEAKLNRGSVAIKNIPFTSAELREEAKNNPKFRLMNTEDNRRLRRHTEAKKQIQNNRNNNGPRVLQRMAYFYLNFGKPARNEANERTVVHYKGLRSIAPNLYHTGKELQAQGYRTAEQLAKKEVIRYNKRALELAA